MRLNGGGLLGAAGHLLFLRILASDPGEISDLAMITGIPDFRASTSTLEAVSVTV